MVLAMAFVAALGVVGEGLIEDASAQGPYFGRRAGVAVGGFGGYGGYGGFVYPQVGGYQAAAIRMGAYPPVYYNGYYGYPNVGPAYPYNNGGYYGGGNNNVIVIGF
jgi:hypothetical protein